MQLPGSTLYNMQKYTDGRREIITGGQVVMNQVLGVKIHHAPRRGFRIECCPPTSLHRLCGQRNDKLGG